jgi:FMN phosphatase YigB (HAD superfamily)
MTMGRRFIHFLLSNFSIALTDTSHAVPGLGELAAFIAGNSISTDSTLSVNQRLSKVGEWFNLWESTAKELKASTLDLLPVLPATNEADAANPTAVEKPIERSLPGTAADAPPLWQRDESLKEIGAQLSRQPSSIRVISFDFFDTLVGRLCATPADLFIEVGRQLAARGWFSRPCTPMEFHSARVAADARARKSAASRGLLPEIKLADIYAELKNIVTDVTAAAQLEFDIERQYIFLNPATLSLARHAKALGYQLAVISDTYFTAPQLRQLLSENGCAPGLFDLVLASCEHGKAKWNGQLYQELFKHFDIHPAELLHVGDDKNSDIHSARQYGVQAVEYYKSNPQLDRLLFTERKLRGTDQHPAGSLDSLRILTARRADSDQDTFRDGAFVFGPVLARYADWCVAKFKAAKIHTVLALMREGELLGELVRRAAAAAGVELKIVTCFTSRRATARASLTETTPAAVMELLEGSATVTFQSILDVLGLGEEIARQCDPKVLEAAVPVDHRLIQLLNLLFKNPRVQQLLADSCAASHALAFDYLTSLTGNETRVGILDIGWGGSIQRNIARILRRNGREVRTFGCYLARTSKTGRLALDGDEVHAFMEQDWNQSTILPELAISSTVGSTNDYQRDATGAVQPVLGLCELTPAERELRRRIRDGILEFQSFWLHLRSQKRYSLPTLADLDQQTASIFYRLLEYPSKAEADRLGSLTHDENYFGAHLTSPLCDEPAGRLVRRDGMHALIQTTRCHWPQGVLARENPRLVNALSLGWRDPSLMGRLGARHGSAIGEQGFTDDEVSALGILVSGLELRQLILVGPLVPAMAEVFQLLWRQEKDDPLKKQPRLIIAGSDGGSSAGPEFLSRCTFVNGALDDPQTIHALRAALVPGTNAALVVPGELPEPELSGLLNGLAPFLGRDGALFIACGRYDRNAILETLPAAKTVNAWRQKNAGELGFGLWTGPAALSAQLGNWLVFRRALTQLVWNNQWTFTAADLAVAEPTEDLLVKP